MRFYDYRCDRCGKIQEYFESTHSDEKRTCECGGEMKRMISAVSFNIKKKPAYWGMSASERRRRWNSPDPKEKI